ncbi:MAG: hypothetical protein M3Y56_02340, partial [Armatimonadota bacterium]|nr:hypothetical protein [Armatimonadota bacterium]
MLHRKAWVTVGCLFLFLPLCTALRAQQITSGALQIRAVRDGGAYTGFDLVSGGVTAATVRLSSTRLLTALHCETSRDGRFLTFSGLRGRQDTGLRMGLQDSVTVALPQNDPYPRISFNLTIAAFDPVKWQAAVGKQPFHFLALYLRDAEVWHQRGWLNATPHADPFPLLGDVHIGTPEISGYHYNRNWSYTPPLGAHPIPIIGLWAPAKAQYVGLEFAESRLRDNSEADIATGYCWNPGGDPFAALVYPYGGTGYQQLVFPKTGTRLQSEGTLLWSLNLPATGDPNRLFWDHFWKEQQDRLPRVPAVVDLSWIPGKIRLPDFSEPGETYLFGPETDQYVKPGTVTLNGWGWRNESPVPLAVHKRDPAAMQPFETQAETLLRSAKYFTVGGDPCVFWDKPLEGEWADHWGGAAVHTLHNANGFAAGRLFLGLYHEAGHREYLPIVDGVFNWAKHIAWTRNEFADVPSSPFAIGGTLSASFCLDYAAAFRDAPDAVHRLRAQQALDLAHSFTYRYMVMWASDNNRFDNIDSSFLWEPNSGRDWTGAACANEVLWNLDTLAQTAVQTGDPVLMWALQG